MRDASRLSSTCVLRNSGRWPAQFSNHSVVKQTALRLQALLDVYTIQREIGRLENVRIGLVGDLANGRTVRSLAYLLSMYSGVKIYFVAPEVVCMKDDIKEFLDSRGVAWEEADDLKQVREPLLLIFCPELQDRLQS